ncbi:MAG: hypothetical protein M5U34_13095 [Chloroflexi bacterium]|nr:hypothetical protein [Chloroflexota bacterium]
MNIWHHSNHPQLYLFLPIARPPDYQTTRLPDYLTTRLPDYLTTRLLDYSTTRLLDYSTTRLLDYSTNLLQERPGLFDMFFLSADVADGQAQGVATLQFGMGNKNLPGLVDGIH